MEKNISSHDASDMLLYEGMYVRSRQLYLRNRFVPFLKEKLSYSVSLLQTQLKRIKTNLLEVKENEFMSPAVALLIVSSVACTMMMFWFALLFSTAS